MVVDVRGFAFDDRSKESLVMSTQTQILTELSRLDEAGLQALYPVIQQFVETHRADRPPLLSRLAEIQIDGPEDLSANHDQYAIGAKRA